MTVKLWKTWRERWNQLTSRRALSYIAVFPSNFWISRITPRSAWGAVFRVTAHIRVGILATSNIFWYQAVTMGALWGPYLTSTACSSGVHVTAITNSYAIVTTCTCRLWQALMGLLWVILGLMLFERDMVLASLWWKIVFLRNWSSALPTGLKRKQRGGYSLFSLKRCSGVQICS